MAVESLMPSALAYIQWFQWPVFPVHSVVDGHCTCGKPACKRPGKHPVAQLAPRGLLDATTDPAQLAAWWAEFPSANIGLPCGAGSGLVVLDVDVLKGGDDGLDTLLTEHGPLPATVMAITGSGGYHYLFAHPGGDLKIHNSVETRGRGLDVRGDGGYIIVAPSRHASGRCYEWEASCHPKDTPLAPLPDWLRAKLTESPRPATPPPDRRVGHRIPPWELRRIQGALGFINPENYDVWLQTGMALHSTGDDDQGLALWTEWAQVSPKFDLADHQRRWASFHRGAGGVSLGSLFAAAKAGGYSPPAPTP